MYVRNSAARSSCLLAVAVACIVGLTAVEAPEAFAQDDWDVKRDPFDQSLIARYKRYLAKNPFDAGALRKLVQMYRRYRSVDLLVGQYEKELAKKRTFETLVVLGKLALESGKKDQALARYLEAAKLQPDHGHPFGAALNVDIGDMYRKSAQLDEARKHYESALATSKNNKVKIRVLKALADIALSKGDIDSARKFYDQYFVLDPKNIQARIDLGDALLSHEKYAEAIAAFRGAEKKLGGDPALRVQVVARIGQVLERSGKSDEAIAEYRRAISMVGKGYYLRRELTSRIIDIYRERDQLSILAADLEKKWSARGRGHFEWDVLARLYEETGLQEKALIAYRAAVKKAPYELDTQRRLINLLETSGREDEALQAYEAVIRVAPGEPRFQLELAQRYWRMGKEKAALALCKKIASRFPGDPGVFSALADLYSRWQKEDLALGAYQKLARIEPDEVDHLVNLGEQYYQRNLKEKARGIWKKIIRKKTAPNYARLAEVYDSHGEHTEAIEMYKQAIRLDPTKARYYKGRASVFERRKQLAQAVADWHKVLELTPDRAANRPARTEARRKIVGLYKRTPGSVLSNWISQWRQAFYKNPPDIGAGYFLVEAYDSENKLDKVQQVLLRLLEINKKDTEAMTQLVKVYRMRGRYNQAIDLLKTLAKLQPQNSRQYYYEISDILSVHLRKDDKSIEYLTTVRKQNPNDPSVNLQLAKLYVGIQRYNEAIESYKQVLKYDARNTEAHFSLARLYRNNNQLADAAALYRKLLESSRSEEVLLKAGRLAINLEEMIGSLGELERTLAPLTFKLSHKDVYRRVLVHLYGRYVPQLVYKQTYGKKAERAAATAELTRLGKHGLKPLLEALADENDPEQQRIAVSVLGYMGNKGAAPALVRLAKERERDNTRVGTLFGRGLDWNVRVEALVAAGRLGDSRTLPSLIELTRHREKTMREAATFALGMTGDPRAIKPLIEALDDSRPSVATLACLAMARIDSNATTAAMIKTVSNERLPDHSRAACAYALGARNVSSAVKPLAATLRQGNHETQRLAAWALGRIGDTAATRPLLTAYFSKRDRVRDAVAWALARVVAGKPDTSDLTGHTAYPLDNGKFDESEAIAQVVGELEPPPLMADFIGKNKEALLAGINRALSRHRDLVVRVLGDLDSVDGGIGLGPLTARLQGASDARLQANLDDIGAQLKPQLVALTEHTDAEIRRRALSVIAKLGDRSVKPIIEKAYGDELLSVRLAAIAAVGRYFSRTRDASVATRLIGLLARSKSWQERREASVALGLFDGAAAVEDALISAIGSDDNSFVRASAARAIGALKGKSGVPALIRALDPKAESNPAVRAAAAIALGEIDTAEAREARARAARADPASEVRAAAGGEKKK
jgi:tetratricopeptide (TPR) repeat protein